MELILIEDVPKLGRIGDLVTVKPGYGRNFLLPKGLAIQASVKSKARFDHEKRLVARRLERARNDAAALAERLGSTSVTIARKAGEQDKLYGSVTSRDIEEALTAEGFRVDRRNLVLDEPIKTLGVYQVPARLTAGVTAQVKVWVVAE